MAQKPETAIVKKIKDWLEKHGCFVYKTHGTPMSRKGQSDLIGCLPDGKMLAIEVKQPGKKATELQLRFILAITNNNGVAFVSTSVEDTKFALISSGYHFD